MVVAVVVDKHSQDLQKSIPSKDRSFAKRITNTKKTEIKKKHNKIFNVE